MTEHRKIKKFGTTHRLKYHAIILHYIAKIYTCTVQKIVFRQIKYRKMISNLLMKNIDIKNLSCSYFRSTLDYIRAYIVLSKEVAIVESPFPL